MAEELTLAPARLQHLEIEQNDPDAVLDTEAEESQRPMLTSRLPSVREGYGFRPSSGSASPFIHPSETPLLPDSNGLGWPGD